MVATIQPAAGPVSVRDEEGLRQALRQLRHQYGRHLGEILVARELISNEQLDEAVAGSRQRPDMHLGRWLVERGWLRQEDLIDALAEQFGIPRVHLVDYPVRPEIAAMLPDELALRHNVLPLAKFGRVLVIATADPFDERVLAELRFYTNHSIEPVLAPPEEIGQVLNRYYAGEAATRATAELNEPLPSAPAEHGRDPELEALRKPVVRLASSIILHAIHRGASDINVRPAKDRVEVYYRVDGRMRLMRSLERHLLPALVARIKIMGNMNVAEHRLPQDGHARVRAGDKSVDLRISVMPTVTGESAVLRILDQSRGLKRLEDLGFTAADRERLEGLIDHPQGLFLITGPTGSGKSTTLYAMLQVIRRGGPHIITVEDPVEYDMDGIEQIQVQPGIGYTFAESLRHILRHDPDVIMVGEIRDLETAQIANKAALTGHLVLSTLHTNDAASAVTRLLDMGVEPYLLANTLLGAMAQRLVRLNCPHCKQVEEVPEHVRRVLGAGPGEVFYRGTGCEACDDTGFHGRIVTYELLSVSPALEELITRGADTARIHARARSDGMVPLNQHVLSLARQGLTALSEAYAVRLNQAQGEPDA